ncbi:beta-galactosidase [Streptomyces bluensis]|uniref:beta-galactosidase n=1 Tax=Streptomyces bluensis TaxID=33897 RepID=UPI0033207721
MRHHRPPGRARLPGRRTTSSYGWARVNPATVGVFSWTLLEPEQGRHDFSWPDARRCCRRADAVAQEPGQALGFCLEETDSPDGRRRHVLINHRTATPHLPGARARSAHRGRRTRSPARWLRGAAQALTWKGHHDQGTTDHPLGARGPPVGDPPR